MKILIRATNWVGDAILALPALRQVRGKFPDAVIAVVARPYVADLYRDQEICNELILYDPRDRHQGWRGRERLAKEIGAKKFDVALLLQNAFDAAWLVWRAGVPERIGYARDGRSFLLTKPVAVPKQEEIPAHEKFYYLELLRRAGWISSLPDDAQISLHVSGPARQRAAQRLLDAGASTRALRIAIGAGASYGSAKCWPPERFAECAEWLQDRSDAEVILFGAAPETSVSEAIAAKMKRKPIDLTGKTAIAEVPALLSQCHVFLGNDSGAMHVAAAVGLPVIAVFGPTNPHATSPVTPRCSIVQDKPYCSPCFLRRCPTDHRCMRNVTSAMVAAASIPWLSGLGIRLGQE